MLSPFRFRRRALPRTIAAGVLVAFARLGAAELPFTHFTPEAGPARLPSSSVQKVMQDRIGYVWTGYFSSGLGRYNGHAITTYSVTDGLGDLTVRDFIEDASGRLWVTSETGVVASERPLDEVGPESRIRFTTKFGSTQLPDQRMGRDQIALHHHGRLPNATPNGVETYRFSSGGALDRALLDSSGEGEASILAAGPGGSLWVAFESGAFGRAESNGDRVMTWRDPQLSATLASALFERVPGELWAGTVSGELWRRKGEGAFELVSKALTERIPAITAAGRDLWVASLGSGVLRLDAGEPSMATRIGRADGLLGDTVWSITGDREGNLWFAQNGGLSRLRSDYRAFTTLTASRRSDRPPALPAPECFGILPPVSSDGIGSWTWVATGAGVAIRDREGRSGVVGPKDGLLSGSVYSVARDGRGRIWLGTAAGLNAIVLEGDADLGGLTTAQSLEILGRKATIVSFIALEPERVYSCRVLDVADGGRTTPVVFTAGSSGVHGLVDGDWLAFEAESGRAAAYDMTLDAIGHLWVATPQQGVMRSPAPLSMEGLRAASSGQAPRGPRLRTVWSREGGALSNHFRALAVSGDQVWAGAAGSVAVFDARAFERSPKPRLLSGSAGLGDSIAASIAASPSGEVWVSHGNAIVEVDPSTLVVKRTLTRRDGLVDGEVWGPGATAFDADGRLHVATPRGVSIVDVRSLSAVSGPPILRMENFSLRTAGKGRATVSLEYAALSYRNEEGTRFRSRLFGHEEQWSEWTSATSVRFSSLPAARAPYQFEVEACSAEGRCTSAPMRFEFSVPK